MTGSTSQTAASLVELQAMGKPLAIDLFCGLGGWAEGFPSEGYDVIGFDIERHDYGTGGYPGQLVLQDILTLHGSQFRHATVIVASPPCQKYSYMAMPWGRAKTEIAWQKWFRDSESKFANPFTLNHMFDACFRIQREASEASGHEIPMVVENVKGAQPWVGRARWHYGSYYLWGDVPALMPFTAGRKSRAGSWDQNRANYTPDHAWDDGQKVETPSWSEYKRTGQVSAHWRMEAVKNNGSSWFNQAHNTESGVGQNPDGRKGTGGSWYTPEADARTPGHWKESGCVTRCFNSKDSRRKAASAQIAKIPFELARHIAAVYKPHVPSAVYAPKADPNRAIGTETPSRAAEPQPSLQS